MSGAHQDMPEESISRILIINLNFKRRKKLPNGSYDRIRLLIFNQAVLHGKDSVGTLHINAGNDLPLFVPGHDRMDFVPVMPRILHTGDGMNPAVRL